MASIRIESKNVTFNGADTGYNHSYLLFDDNDVADTGDLVIRGTGNAQNRITLQIAVPIEDSADARRTVTPADRGDRVVSSAGAAAQWSLMTQMAVQIEAAQLAYTFPGGDGAVQNSNSVVATLLHAVGFDIANTLPANATMAELTGSETILDFARTLTGGDGDDTIVGWRQDDRLSGGNGNDELRGGDGDDRLYGETGNDMLVGGAGNDRLDGGTGVDTLAGGAGDDRYYIGDAAAGIVEAADAGFDRVYAKVDYTLSAGAAVEYLAVDGSVADRAITLVGNDYANRIISGSGDDVLDGAGGDDALVGGAGNDRLLGGAGADRLDGGAGVDVLIGGMGDDRYYIGDYTDRVVEADGGGYDRVYAKTDYALDASAAVEYLAADGSVGARGLTLIGNGYANRVVGGEGADVLVGGRGDDRLEGSNGDDLLIGGAGMDTLVGGDGMDIFAFGVGDTVAGREGADRIADFGLGDMIDLSGFREAVAGNGALHFADAFDGEAGAVIGYTKYDRLYAAIDLDGDRRSDAMIRVDGVTKLYDANFLL